MSVADGRRLSVPQVQYWAGRTPRPNNGTPNMAAALPFVRNLSPFWAGTLSVATWYGVNRRYGIWMNIYTDLWSVHHFPLTTGHRWLASDNSSGNWKRFYFGVNWLSRLATVYLCVINILTYMYFLTYFARRLPWSTAWQSAAALSQRLAARHSESLRRGVSHLSGNGREALHCAESLSSSSSSLLSSSHRKTSCQLHVASRRLRHRITQVDRRSDAAVHVRSVFDRFRKTDCTPACRLSRPAANKSILAFVCKLLQKWRLLFERLTFFDIVNLISSHDLEYHVDTIHVYL